MANHITAGVESSAISILKRAVELDNSKRFDEALTCYQEGVALLMQVLKSEFFLKMYLYSIMAVNVKI